MVVWFELFPNRTSGITAQRARSTRRLCAALCLAFSLFSAFLSLFCHMKIGSYTDLSQGDRAQFVSMSKMVSWDFCQQHLRTERKFLWKLALRVMSFTRGKNLCENCTTMSLQTHIPFRTFRVLNRYGTNKIEEFGLGHYFLSENVTYLESASEQLLWVSNM